MPITPVGSTFVHGTAGGTPSTTLGDVISISDSGDTYAIMEYATTTATVTSKLAGRMTPGTVTVDIYYDGDAADWENVASTSGIADGTVRSFGITFSDGNTWSGDGIISQTASVEVGDDVVRGTFTIEKTSAWTLA